MKKHCFLRYIYIYIVILTSCNSLFGVDIAYLEFRHDLLYYDLDSKKLYYEKEPTSFEKELFVQGHKEDMDKYHDTPTPPFYIYEERNLVLVIKYNELYSELENLLARKEAKDFPIELQIRCQDKSTKCIVQLKEEKE